MARNLDRSRGVDPENLEAMGAAPRSRRNIRENDARNSRMARKRKDKFYVPPSAIPHGWVVEWKRRSCLGKQEEVDYQMDLADAGWKFADPAVYPMLVPEGHEGRTIERGGMVLMTRPAHMQKESKKLDREEAMGQVREKMSEIGMTAEGELPRRVQGISREFDRPAGRMIPEDDGDDYEAGYENGDDRSNRD